MFDENFFRKEKIGKFSSSYFRFKDRLKNYGDNNRSIFNHYKWWFIHNVIAHPLLIFIFNKSLTKQVVKLHDYTSDKLSLGNSINSTYPEPQNKLWWIIHNLIIHPLIGIVPCKITFSWHDISARKMKTYGWM